jgi:aryl-alcohol dehydrogenase-like predicted oxidoreductase
MEYVNVGGTGLRVSRVCLGMMSFGRHETRPWALDEAAADPIVRRAVEGGIIFFDTADVYNGGQSEVVTGRVLRKLFGMREEYVVATKVHGRTMPGENGRGLSRKHILASIDASLERLGLDYVDLYQIHRWDKTTPIDETMGALHDVVKAGKARYIGASSMYAWQFAKAQGVAPTPFVSMQNHYNLIYREEEREMIPQCIDQGVGVIPWSPLARGLLARGNEQTTRAGSDPFLESLYKPELDRLVIERLTEMAGAVAQAGRDRANRRRNETRAHRGRARGRGDLPERRRDRATRGAVRAAFSLGHRVLAPRAERGCSAELGYTAGAAGRSSRAASS